MGEVRLIMPAKEHEFQAKEFIQEFIDNNSEINGVGGLNRYLDDYDGWLVKLQNDLDLDSIKPG